MARQRTRTRQQAFTRATGVSTFRQKRTCRIHSVLVRPVSVEGHTMTHIGDLGLHEPVWTGGAI